MSNMELKTFISKTLVEISTGVLEAQKSLLDKNVLINPLIGKGFGETRHPSIVGVALGQAGQAVLTVDFDLVVTISEESETGGKISVIAALIGGIGGSINSRDSTESSAANTIKFSVPIAFPGKSTRLV